MISLSWLQHLTSLSEIKISITPNKKNPSWLASLRLLASKQVQSRKLVRAGTYPTRFISFFFLSVEVFILGFIFFFTNIENSRIQIINPIWLGPLLPIACRLLACWLALDSGLLSLSPFAFSSKSNKAATKRRVMSPCVRHLRFLPLSSAIC